ncbi:MAG: hypothetical protein HYX90_06775, partial [Chloroflexi bacterium]|nr:hypothetical protein [Chloroflexota bacterium]
AKRSPIFPPDLMTAKQLYEKVHGKPPSGTAWEAYRGLLAADSYDKVLALPPATPNNIVRVYWDAAQKMIKDPAFIAISDRILGKDTPWGAGEEYDKKFKREFGMKPDTRAFLQDLLATKYGMKLN